MRTVLQKIFLLIALLMVPESSICGADSDINMIAEEFDFKKISKQEPFTQQPNHIQSGQLAVIENNLLYVVITAGLYAFSLVIITFLMKITPNHQARDLVTSVGLVSVIFGMILLVLVVDTDEALTAPMGVMGAIAGYLFGTAQRREVSQE